MSGTDNRSKRVTIFEGPDGAGKSTVARAYAEATDARYVHLSSFPQVGGGLARLYIEAMLPALLGYQDVVLDRCWLSEVPYGNAFRAGADRLGTTTERMLTRVAMRCGAVVVRCLPPWEVVRDNYQCRRAQELLETEEQLRQVYAHYAQAQPLSTLPEVRFDYTQGEFSADHYCAIDLLKMAPHPLTLASAGNWEAPIVLVGETFGAHKPFDPLQQYPFVSFSQQGCSQWLTAQLIASRVPEDRLLWCNADQDLAALRTDQPRRFIALGDRAFEALAAQGLAQQATCVNHPQHHKRFMATTRYPLLDILETYHDILL